jgi:hypothetical protein
LLQRFVVGIVFMLALNLVPGTAKAEFTLAGSLGFGFQVNPSARVGGVNFMLTPGYQFLDVLRIELGILGAIENAIEQGTDVGLEFRPMLVLAPPTVPLYGRLIFASVDPFSDARRTWAYGLGVGLAFEVGAVQIFGEVAALPRYFNSAMRWLLEARGGLQVHF